MQTDTQNLFITSWFISVFLTLIVSLMLFFYLSQARFVTSKNNNFRLYASLPASRMEVSEEVIKKDARSKIVEDFFKGYQSPLAALSDKFIEVSDKYKLDYRLLPSIAMQESNGGKKIINNSNNPFGYGIYSGSVIKFSSWQEAIERVGRALREDYLNKGLKSPHQIMAKYTPPAVPTGSWAKGVSTFMEELQ